MQSDFDLAKIKQAFNKNPPLHITLRPTAIFCGSLSALIGSFRLSNGQDNATKGIAFPLELLVLYIRSEESV
jgi:hypothetical protein